MGATAAGTAAVCGDQFDATAIAAAVSGDSGDGGRPIHISAEVGSSPNYSYIFDFEREFDSVEVKQVWLILI